MAKARRSRRTLTTLIVLVLISVSVITLDQTGRAHSLISGTKSVASTVFSPVRSGVNGVLDPIGRFFAGAFHYGALEQENEKLRAQVGRLRQQVASSAFERHQEHKLQELLALNTLAAVHQLPKVPAEVTAFGPSNFAATVTIDRGRSQGVVVGDPVMATGGLVGRVVKASHTTATVQLVTDGQSKVGVTYGNGQFATLAGQGPGHDPAVQLVSTNTAISTGQELVTDGLAGAQFPPGIPVAKVASVHALSGAADKQVTAEPVADLARLTYVEVLQWSPAP